MQVTLLKIFQQVSQIVKHSLRKIKVMLWDSLTILRGGGHWGVLNKLWQHCKNTVSSDVLVNIAHCRV